MYNPVTQKRANEKYDRKIDKIMVRVPAGTKRIIEALTEEKAATFVANAAREKLERIAGGPEEYRRLLDRYGEIEQEVRKATKK